MQDVLAHLAHLHHVYGENKHDEEHVLFWLLFSHIIHNYVQLHHGENKHVEDH